MLVAACMLFQFGTSDAQNKSVRTPDFNFPKDVIKQANKNLEDALAENDQNKAVVSLIQLGLAETAISSKTADSLLAKIDGVISDSRMTPDYKALLWLVEYNIWSRRPRDGKYDNKERAQEAWDLAFNPEGNGKIESLTKSIKEYEEIITPGSDLGNRFIPTLYDFMAEQYLRIAYPEGMDKILANRNRIHKDDKDPMARMYLETREWLKGKTISNEEAEKIAAIYDKYEPCDESAILMRLIGSRAEYYPRLCQYVKSHPRSAFLGEMKNLQASVEACRVSTTYPRIVQSVDTIHVNARVANVNEYTLTLYKVTDEMIEDDEKENIVQKMDFIESRVVNLEGKVPFKVDQVITGFSPQPIGQYVILTSYYTPEGLHRDEIIKGKELKSRLFSVSNLRPFTCLNRIFAVDSHTGQPLKGVSVNEINVIKDSVSVVNSMLTNVDGYVTIKEDHNFRYTLTRDNDKYLTPSHFWFTPEISKNEESSARIFTDLAIYRPGETAQVTVVAFRRDETSRKPLNKTELTITLLDASGNETDQALRVMTDEYGQVSASLVIPTDRMNGAFTILVTGENIEKRRLISVSEYKAPTFYVDLSETATNQPKGQPARIKGRVMTYAGLPVATCQVQCELTPNAWWGYCEKVLDVQEFTVETDADGWFEYTCPAEWTATEDNGWRSFNIFELTADCTNQAGETQRSKTVFWLGQCRALSLNDEDYKIDPRRLTTISLNYSTTDATEENPQCHYQLINRKGEVVADSIFDILKPEVSWVKMPSGSYTLKANLVGENKYTTAQITLYRESDTRPPVQNALWIPKASQRVMAVGQARILIGNNVESWIYSRITSLNKVEQEGWIHYKAGMHWLDLKMPAGKDEILEIQMYTMHDGKTITKKIRLESPDKDVMKVAAVSFRDKLIPGSHERWTFSLTNFKNRPVPGRMIMEIYNQALQDLESNTWAMNVPYTDRHMGHIQEVNFLEKRNNTMEYSELQKNVKIIDDKQPAMQKYGREFFGMPTTRVRLRGNALQAKESTAEEEEAGFIFATQPAGVMVYDDADMMSSKKEEATATSKEDALNRVPLRTEMTKVALWAPQVTSDPYGNIAVEWDVPSDNTTWYMQALAFNQNLAAGTLVKQVIASRPIMVQSSLPRFLRAGDNTKLAANVMNSSNDTLTATVQIELFEPRTQSIITRERMTLTMAPQTTEVVTINCNAPTQYPYLGFRIKAASEDGNGDGEQQLLPIISAETTAIETTAFYLNPDQNETVIDVPQGYGQESTDRMILEFCGNPIWYSITALPSVASAESNTSIGVAHNLYASALAARYAEMTPKALDYINQWKQMKDDKANPLTSMLKKNADQKYISLLASPWLPEAERQGMRMAALDQLFIKSQNKVELDRIINSLKIYCRKDGGFAWIDDRNHSGLEVGSSYWATSTVVELIGRLWNLGCMTKDADIKEMMNNAVHYLDTEALKLEDNLQNNDTERKNKYAYMRFFSYLYLRSLTKGIEADADKSERINRLTSRTLEALADGWTELNFPDRAIAAMVLYRNGNNVAAKKVIESLRQFATRDERLGMYWQRAAEGTWFSPVACTTVMLRAFYEVDPKADEIDEIRKWLLLEKQTSDWGNSSLAADAVYALLTTGSDWLNTGAPQISVSLAPHVPSLNTTPSPMGYIKLELPAGTQQVKIQRSGATPAWGSLFHQYIAPMSEIKEESMDGLKIEKKVTINDNKAKVQLIVTNDKALEYVVIRDERAACLEPIEQTAGYHWGSDSYYLENKDNETRIFLNVLKPGRHTFTYECGITNHGNFATGIATIQSMYAPQYTAHSNGDKISNE